MVNAMPAADDSFSDFSLSNRDRKLAGYKTRRIDTNVTWRMIRESHH